MSDSGFAAAFKNESPRMRMELVRLRIDRGRAAHAQISTWMENRAKVETTYANDLAALPAIGLSDVELGTYAPAVADLKAEAEALGTAHRALAEKLRHFGETLFDAVNKDDKYLKATANLRKHDDLLKELDAQGIANYQPPAPPAEKDKKGAKGKAAAAGADKKEIPEKLKKALAKWEKEFSDTMETVEKAELERLKALKTILTSRNNAVQTAISSQDKFIAAAHARTVSLDPAADIKAFGAQKDVAAYVSDPALLQTLIRQTTPSNTDGAASPPTAVLTSDQAAKGPAAAAPEPVAKTGFSSFDLLDGDVPPMVAQAPLFGATPLAPSSAGTAAVVAASDAAAPPAPAVAPAPAPAPAAAAVAAAAAPAPGGLTRTESTASAKDLAKDPPKGKEKADKAPKEKLGLFGTLMGRKKKEKGDTDEFAPPPVTGGDADAEVVSAPARNDADDASAAAAKADMDGFAANPFQKRRGAAGKDDDDSSDDEDDKKPGGDGSDREIKPRFAIKIRSADEDAAAVPDAQISRDDVANSLKSISLVVPDAGRRKDRGTVRRGRNADGTADGEDIGSTVSADVVGGFGADFSSFGGGPSGDPLPHTESAPAVTMTSTVEAAAAAASQTPKAAPVSPSAAGTSTATDPFGGAGLDALMASSSSTRLAPVKRADSFDPLSSSFKSGADIATAAAEAVPLDVTVAETVNAQFGASVLENIKVTGEINVAASAAVVAGVRAFAQSGASLDVHITNCTGKIIPNKIVARPAPTSTSHFAINAAALAGALDAAPVVPLFKYMHAAETAGEGLKWAPLQLSATVVKGEAGARTITISYELNRTALPSGKLRNVTLLLSVEGEIRKFEARPQGALSKLQDKAQWKIAEMDAGGESAAGTIKARFELSVPESPLTLLVRYEGARGPTGGVDLELSSPAAGLSLGPRRRTVTAGTYVATLPA